MARIYTSFFFILLAKELLAANEYFPMGARAVALGNASVTISDLWSVFNNVAGVASLKSPQIGFYCQNRYSFSGFNQEALAFALPLKSYGVPSLGIYRFGDNLYSETRASVGWSHKIMGVTLGVQADYLQINIQDYGSKNNIALNFGGQADIIPTIRFAASIFNINQAKVASYQDERIPTIMKAGLSYRPMNKLMANIEIEKNIEKQPLFKAGIEFKLIEHLALRTGFNINPEMVFFGIGYSTNNVSLNYAASSHPQLSFSHSFSIGYIFNKHKSTSETFD